jgi:uncharacterized membrane protein YeaQ/YmgE (transglycosylase-associated protein family)
VPVVLEILSLMALLVLVLLGATLGWLASILARTEGPADILRQIALGLIVSVVAGAIANDCTMLGSLSLLGLGLGLAISAVALVLYHALRRRTAGSRT